MSDRTELIGTAKDINIMALRKDNEHFIFLYSDDNRGEMLRQFGRFAGNPDLNFTWYDSAVLSQRLRQQAMECIK